jgi:hypothetical protein
MNHEDSMKSEVICEVPADRRRGIPPQHRVFQCPIASALKVFSMHVKCHHHF